MSSKETSTFRQLTEKLQRSKKPLLAVLIDPDKFNPELIHLSVKSKVACFLVGGSTLSSGNIHTTIIAIKRISKLPVILFPGDESQLSGKADGLLLLSLLSGRNPDYLIEKHITAAPLIRKLKLEHLSTAYLLIDGGKISTTQKVTQTQSLDPNNKTYILHTALAAEQLGFKVIYLEAGSGAKKGVPAALVKTIKKQVQIPIILGGGIDSVAKAKAAIKTGANMLVIGNALEKNVYLLRDISSCF